VSGQGHPVRSVRIVAEVAVGLVDDDERRIVAESGEEAVERNPPHDRRRRIVRRAQEDDLGPPGHALQQIVEVGLVGLERAQHGRGAGEPRLDRVRLEGRVRHENLVARLEGGARDDADDLVAAVAGHDPVRRDAQVSSDGFAKRRGAAVGIEMGSLGLFPQRFDDLGRRPEWIFVGGQPPERRQSHLLLDHFERFACLIWSHRPERLAPDPFHGCLL
jgi:hypothetical protein